MNGGAMTLNTRDTVKVAPGFAFSFFLTSLNAGKLRLAKRTRVFPFRPARYAVKAKQVRAGVYPGQLGLGWGVHADAALGGSRGV